MCGGMDDITRLGFCENFKEVFLFQRWELTRQWEREWAGIGMGRRKDGVVITTGILWC